MVRMTHEDIRNALLEESSDPKEVRTKDGRLFLVESRERWLLGGGRRVVLDGVDSRLNILSVRNITSIGLPPNRAPNEG